jgi:hypothetical protein
MRALVMFFGALTLASAASAQTPVTFKRPDCSAYSAAQKPERKCVRETRRSWQEANFAALQKTGLMFVYMARPDPKASPDAVKAVQNRIEGSFVIRFSVKTDGTVYDVQTVEVTEGIQPLAKLWAQTIGQWTFAKTSQAVTGIEFRRIYMYAADDDDEDSARRSQQEPTG